MVPWRQTQATCIQMLIVRGPKPLVCFPTTRTIKDINNTINHDTLYLLPPPHGYTSMDGLSARKNPCTCAIAGAG